MMGGGKSPSGAETDHWSAEAYNASASFVPKLAEKVVQYLEPQPTDRVLDIGCGDGVFTANYAGFVEHVLGLDASEAMIEAARKDFGRENVEYRVVDCRHLDDELHEGKLQGGTWDKVVSNAALHWILKDPQTRLTTLQAIHDCLKPNNSSTFVFEMGGHGNVPEVHTALIAALIHRGIPLDSARDAIPWFFPSETWMRNALEQVGFSVEKLEMEYRPTRLTVDEKGGIEGWVRLMGAAALEVLEEKGGVREDAVKEVCDVLETVITREEDGSKWLGYVRLRGVAVRK